MRDIDKFFHKLSLKASDEVQLLKELGPSYFSDEDLLILKGRCIERQRLSNRFSKANMWFGAATPFLLLAAIVLGLSGQIAVAATLLKTFPLAFVLFIAIALLIKREFDSIGQLELWINLIDEELSRRSHQHTKF